jgi:hypothetical protein
MLPASAPSGPTKVWATRGTDGTVRVTLINKDTLSEHDVRVQVPGAATIGSVQTLQAPSVSSTSGVTLGGQTFGDETTTGTLPAPTVTPVAPASGAYTVPVPAGSAALLTIAPAPSPTGGSGGVGPGGGTPLAGR